MTVTINKSELVVATRIGEREVKTERRFNARIERVWRALTDPNQLQHWWGRGNRLVIERFEFCRGGHWRFVEHTPDGEVHGFEGRFREIVEPTRLVQTFEWDGMPGHVVINFTTLEDLGEGRTKLTNVAQFFTREECEGMLSSDMTVGMEQSYQALDRLLLEGDGQKELTILRV